MVSSSHLRLLWWASLWIVSNGAELAAAPDRYLPYVPDAHTLHLWHLDETKPPFTDSAEKSVPLAGLLNGAKAGRPSLAGFKNSIFFNANVGGTPGNADLQGAILAAAPVLASGPADNVDSSFQYFGPDGAFTYEMIVKLDTLPGDTKSVALELVSMDGDAADRVFNFRIEKEGFLAFIPLANCGATGGAIATIPTSGPNALDTKSWFHVAVTYDGNGGVTNNLKLYWTRLGQAEITAANRIGSGTLSADFNGRTGDFAIGNEAREFPMNAEAGPFPGCIDEVRISGVARHPSDFFFIPPELRITPEQIALASEKTNLPPAFKLDLASILVDGTAARLPGVRGKALELESGLHRLDFDFGFSPEMLDGNVRLRCQLEGVDERWQETELGMSLVCQALDGHDRVVSQSRFQSVGRSSGWETSLEDSAMIRRTEPVFIPTEARKLKITLASGSPDTTGFIAINRIALTALGGKGPALWANGNFNYDENTTSLAGSPRGWQRSGDDPAIARIVIRAEHPAIGLVDSDQMHHGEWTAVQNLPDSLAKNVTFALSWDEAYNVIGGNIHRATYINVPPGNYIFRAIGLAGHDEALGDSLSFPIMIHPPFWRRFWFFPFLTALIVAVVAAIIFSLHRQRAKRSMERLRFQNALEKDRTRIARDMHDDLGTRVTFINMSATLAQRDLEQAPQNARRHIAKMKESTRELIVAMDDLVWAVDPAFDTLDHLASHLTRLAEEMFRDSPIRCRLDIPALLPALSLGSEVRHHIALAVKEALHNVLCHAGPSEVFFSLAFDGEEIVITIRDTGVGFDLDGDGRGHGLDNLGSRFKEIGGSCKITSSPGSGTCIVLSCRVAAASS